MQLIVSYCVSLLLALAATLPVAAADRKTQSTLSVIAAVMLEDVTVFSSEALLPAYAASLGRPRTDVEVQALQDSVAAYYKQAGFLEPVVLATNTVSTASSSIVNLRVVEPRIAEIDTSRLSAEQNSAIQRQIQALKNLQAVALGDIDEFRADIESALDIRLDTVVEPMGHDASRYLVKLSRRPSVSGELIYTAEGSQSLGRHMAGATLVVDNPVSGLTELYLTALHTIESDGYGNFGAGATAPVSDHGRLQFDFSNARAVPQYEFASKGTRYRRGWGRLQYVHDFVTTREQEIDLYAGLSLRNYERQEFGLVSLDEQLRILDFGMRSISGSADLAFRVDAGLRLGIDGLGARRKDIFSDEVQDLDFEIFLIDYTIWTSLPAGFSAKLDIAGQYSDQQLPFSQRFSMGGGAFFNAYEAGEFSGDSGIGSRLEIRRELETGYAMLGRLVPYIYYGIASAFENERDSSESAAGAGAGLRLLSNDFSAFIEFSKPLTQPSEYRDSDTRATGRVAYYF